jgi:hypothetical protein
MFVKHLPLSILTRKCAIHEGEVKWSAPCCNILWHVKEPFEVWIKILRKAKFSISFASCALLLDDCRYDCQSSGGPIRSIPPSTSYNHSSPSSHITCGMNKRPAGGRSSETVSPHWHDYHTLVVTVNSKAVDNIKYVKQSSGGIWQL